MALALLLVLLLPTLFGLLLDFRLGLWPWGLIVSLALGIPAATFLIVRFTFDAYRRAEKTHASATSHYTIPSVKEDEHA